VPVPEEVMALHFVRQDGRWKLDLKRLMVSFESSLAEAREQMHLTKVELAIQNLEEIAGKKLPPEILDGPVE
jgi:hypothetical protein